AAAHDQVASARCGKAEAACAGMRGSSQKTPSTTSRIKTAAESLWRLALTPSSPAANSRMPISDPISRRGAISLSVILLLAIAVHGPLLLMKLPNGSYDAQTHQFFASHYAHHWFNPWNDKWFGGFSQTTYPPLAHQWIALFSHIVGLEYA